MSAFLEAKLTPERVSPAEFAEMLSDPRTAICDPSVVSKLIEAKNMTDKQFQVSGNDITNTVDIGKKRVVVFTLKAIVVRES